MYLNIVRIGRAAAHNLQRGVHCPQPRNSIMKYCYV